MYPAGPPAEDVDRVMQQLQTAREHLAGAQERAHRAQLFIERGAVLGHRDSMALRVMLAVRAYEVDLWAAEVDQLVNQARALGVQT